MKKFLPDCPVPIDQQPMNEYLNLKDSLFFFWTTKDIKSYLKYTILSAAVIYSVTLFLITNSGQPVGTLNQADIINGLVYMCIFGGFILSTYFTRLYLGWLYVYERLIKSSVSYEESGWYDGQIWVKTPTILIQDKLIAEYQIAPVLNRLKLTLLSFISSVILGTLYIYT